MSGEIKSKALNMDPVPVVGVYRHDEQIDFFIAEHIREGVDLESLPLKLCRFLIDNERELPPTDKYTYMTIQSNKPQDMELYDENGYYRVNLFFHPYVFLEEGNNLRTWVRAAVFSNSNHISQWSIKPSDSCFHIKVNPERMDSCALELSLHYEDGFKNLSPNNSHIFLKVAIPIHVVYSICIIQHKHKPDRLLICKHVIVLNTDFPLYEHFSTKAFTGSKESKAQIKKIISNLKDMIETRNEKLEYQTFGDLFGYFNDDLSYWKDLIHKLLPLPGSKSKYYSNPTNLDIYLGLKNSDIDYIDTQLYYFLRTLAQELIEFLTEL